MQELEAVWPRVIAIWWLLFWRSLIGAMVLGAIVGGVTGGVLAFLGYDVESATAIFNILGGVIGAAWSIAVTLMALEKDFRGFRIALVSSNPEDATT